jgi:hypothetical protein
MDVRTALRAGGRALLATAMVLTVCEVLVSAPAHADDPVVIIETPPVQLGGGGNQVIVTTTDLDVSGNIIVDNPGSTLLTQQQCLDLSATAGSYCLGTSDQFVSPNNVQVAPYPIQGVPASPYRLPGSAMDWIVDESTALVAAQHGISNMRLVQTFFRPEIRGYIVARMQDIVNKKLYDEPMDDREKAAYAELEAIFKDKLVSDSKWALEEYDKWNANPCGYVPPPPPHGSGLPAVPNDAASSTLCTSAGSRFAVWKITNGTPPEAVVHADVRQARVHGLLPGRRQAGAVLRRRVATAATGARQAPPDGHGEGARRAGRHPRGRLGRGHAEGHPRGAGSGGRAA